MDGVSKIVIVPAFDGSDAHYQIWWLSFKAHAKLAGFGKALKVDQEVDLPDTQEEEEA